MHLRPCTNKPVTRFSTGPSPSFCWFVKSFCALTKLSHSLRCSVCLKYCRFSVVCAVLYDQNRVRGPPIILVGTRRTPPITLLLSMPRRDPPDAVLQRNAMTVRAHARQSDTSHSINGCGHHQLHLFLRKSVLSRRMSCAMLGQPKSAYSTFSQHSFTFILAHALTLPSFWNSSCSFPHSLTFLRSMLDA